MRDMRYQDGRFEPCDPVLPDAADYSHLEGLGWEKFFDVGTDDATLVLRTWRRIDEGGVDTYLLSAWDVFSGTPFVVVERFPDLLDLLARWAPAVQAATIASVVADLDRADGNVTGLVERVAARARFGADEGYEDLLRQRAEARAEAVRRRAARQAAQTKVAEGNTAPES